MSRLLNTTLAAAIALASLLPVAEAAPFAAVPVAAPTLIEDAACTVTRRRVVNRYGRVTYTTVRRCTPTRPVCRTFRERTRRPNGTIVIRTVRRCR